MADGVLLVLPDRDEAEELAARLLAERYAPATVHRDMLTGEDDAEDVDWVVELVTAPDGGTAAGRLAVLRELAEERNGFVVVLDAD